MNKLTPAVLATSLLSQQGFAQETGRGTGLVPSQDAVKLCEEIGRNKKFDNSEDLIGLEQHLHEIEKGVVTNADRIMTVIRFTRKAKFYPYDRDPPVTVSCEFARASERKKFDSISVEEFLEQLKTESFQVVTSVEIEARTQLLRNLIEIREKADISGWRINMCEDQGYDTIAFKDRRQQEPSTGRMKAVPRIKPDGIVDGISLNPECRKADFDIADLTHHTRSNLQYEFNYLANEAREALRRGRFDSPQQPDRKNRSTP